MHKIYIRLNSDSEYFHSSIKSHLLILYKRMLSLFLSLYVFIPDFLLSRSLFHSLSVSVYDIVDGPWYVCSMCAFVCVNGLNHTVFETSNDDSWLFDSWQRHTDRTNALKRDSAHTHWRKQSLSSLNRTHSNSHCGAVPLICMSALTHRRTQHRNVNTNHQSIGPFENQLDGTVCLHTLAFCEWESSC